ncbi:MAG: IS200/IS605 family transposase [Bacteroidetes bacterium]|nr:IS200/IS605 family transposase [Bacteroidota bacterium]MCL2303428.1 IS200/IS605 family transposase [Lentimicrobiaceae bacterium]
MSQSLAKLYVHLIFHVKNEHVFIRPEDEKELYAYMGGIIKKNESESIKIGGVQNHVHILAEMSKNISLSKFLEEIKRNSSRWIKTKDAHYKNFAWQGGYSGYSVSQSKVGIVSNYIEHQKEHHRKITFQEEYLQFLKKYRIDYDEKYLWQ